MRDYSEDFENSGNRYRVFLANPQSSQGRLLCQDKVDYPYLSVLSQDFYSVNERGL